MPPNPTMRRMGKIIITVTKNDPTSVLTSSFLLPSSLCPTFKTQPLTSPPMLCLLDSGATGCWISRKQLPSTIRTNKIPAITNQTLAGDFTSNESITLKHVLLPEFHRTRRLDTLQAKIFDQSCRYDMILGRDLMNDLGIVLNFELKSMEWDKAIVAMREHPTNVKHQRRYEPSSRGDRRWLG